MPHAANFLIRLVSFAGHHHDVTARRRDNRFMYRARAVFDHRAIARCAFEDVRNNRHRRFTARIVAGDNHAVGAARCDAPHHGALAAITIAAAAEYAGQFCALSAPIHFAQRQQNFFQRVRGMGVIHHHQRCAAVATIAFSAAGHGIEFCQHAHRSAQIGVARQQHGERAQQVRGIKTPDHFASHLRRTPRRGDIKRHAIQPQAQIAALHTRHTTAGGKRERERPVKTVAQHTAVPLRRRSRQFHTPSIIEVQHPPL